ncbi:MAG: LD-carboxypeptidase [Deltaproteobacteria bacterium]|nr:LD-carboxypeptidase [Deltaproteobacteria bacterium]
MSRFRQPLLLQPGDCIGVAAPASAFPVEAFTAAVAWIRAQGFQVRHRPDITQRLRYFAGDDKRRAEELNALLCDPTIKAVFCARGGYGTQRIIPLLHHEAIAAAAPKIFVGSSDLTVLHGWLQRHCGWTTFYGPTITHHFGDVPTAAQNWQHLWQAIGQPQPLGTLASGDLRIIKPGRATGCLAGGCLSLVHASIDTAYGPTFDDDTILFLEDRGEKLYALDRMLTHLAHADVLRHVRGIIFGSLALSPDEPNPADLDTMLADCLRDFVGPVVAGLPAGHCDPCLTLPLGAQATLHTDPLDFSIDTAGVLP